MENYFKMSEISNNQNLNSHYTTNAKAVRPIKTVVSAPEVLPKTHLFDDKKANQRMYSINNDIYQDYKKEKVKENKNIVKNSIVAGAGILGVLGLVKFFK